MRKARAFDDAIVVQLAVASPVRVRERNLSLGGCVQFNLIAHRNGSYSSLVCSVLYRVGGDVLLDNLTH